MTRTRWPLAPLLAPLLAMATAAQAVTPLADQPVFTNAGVPGNLALALSVEFPTAVSVAHIDATYTAASTYLGYFDPDKCYGYSYNAVETQRHFFPSGAAVGRKCTGAQDGKWSGNFLNWATMQTIDPFRWALTGGYRVVDTATTTILEKAWASGQGGTGNFPNRSLGSNTLVVENTPFTWNSMAMRVQGLGNKLRFTVSGDVNIATATAYDPAVAVAGGTVYEVSVRVKVCDTTAGAGPLEKNCTAYPSGHYKPTGLLQQYAEKIRFSTFGYLNDSALTRDGGVLRARQKFIGPKIVNPTGPAAANPAAEWDADTGVLFANPDAADATATQLLYGVPVSNSGVINYLNKFGQITPGSYKTYDPVGELYYAAIRYFKNLGNVPEWTSMAGANAATKTTWIDGFPVITSWDDPILYSCQKNFVLGIGDVNTHADKNVPGNGTPSGNEPAKPASLALDPLDAVAMTNKVGLLHGLGANLGTTNPYNGCCNNNSALMAGIAYDANGRDIRPDDPAKPNTKGRQTVQTYWLDILEYQTYKANNQFYLAAKYGGAQLPENFVIDAQNADLPVAWWRTNTDTVGTGGSAQPRPDSYFTAAKPDQMVSGLSKIFADAASRLAAYTTSFSTALPQVTQLGTGSYSAKYDSGTWTGEISASESAFDPATGEPTLTTRWNFSTKLEAQSAGTGWNTARRVVTFNPTTGAGAPLRSGSLTAAQLSALDTAFVAGNDAGDFLNWLRGDRTYEAGQPAATADKTYRRRSKLLGDIVGSKTKAVGAPVAPFAAATNPGYGAFKTAWKDRLPMVYVGANDGMLHAVDASLDGSKGGTPGNEVFAYVPNALFAGPNGTPAVDGLQSLGKPEYVHHFMVDGSPAVFDVDFGRTAGGSGAVDWRTILVGGLGKGGRAYYAIDVTNPAALTTEAAVAAKVLWEFTHPDLGYTFGEPMAVKTKKHGWVLVFGSGHNNADGRGYLFIVNPRTGQLLEKIGTGTGSVADDAGLAWVQPFVPDRTDGTADSVYAGDLLGNLWRWDVSGMGAFPAPVKLAELTDANGQPVPVTSRPLVVVQPGTNRRFVTVGSGRLLHNTDIGNPQPQTYYALVDGTGVTFNKPADLPAGIAFPITRNKLKKLVDLTQKVVLDFDTQMGWWIDLGSAAGAGPGWRVISDSTSFLGTVAFSAMLPSAAVCEPSGTSRVYAIDLGTGQSRLQVGDAVVAYSTAVPGVVTDLRFYSVAGTPRLIAGSDTGATRSLKGNWGGSGGLRRLNWRELPLAD